MSSDNATEKEVNSRFEMVKQKYGDRLSDEELEAVREDVQSLVEAAQEIRAVKLDGSSEPPTVFVPYRKDG